MKTLSPFVSNLVQSVVRVQALSIIRTVLIFFCLFDLLATTGCQSGNENEIFPQVETQTPTPASPYYSKCKVMDLPCFGSTANTTLLTYDYKGDPQYAIIFAMKLDNNPWQDLAVSISLKKFTGLGKYTLTGTNTNVDYFQRPAGEQFESTKVRGTLEVTDYQPKKFIAGKFAIYSEDGTHSLELKEGEFKIETDF